MEAKGNISSSSGQVKFCKRLNAMGVRVEGLSRRNSELSALRSRLSRGLGEKKRGGGARGQAGLCREVDSPPVTALT